MEYPKRKNLRIPDFDYSENRAYFVTICTHERERSLSNLVPEHPGQPSLLPLGKMAEQCLLELP